MLIKKLLIFLNVKNKNERNSKIKPENGNGSLFTTCVFHKIPNTDTSVFKQKEIFSGMEKDSLSSQNHTNNENEFVKFNTFQTYLKYVYNNQGESGLLPKREETEKALNITRAERLKFVEDGIQLGLLIKKGNNKVYFNQNADMNDILKGEKII